MPKLTKSFIDQCLPKEKDYFVWDSEIKGFGCRILKGDKKTYVFYCYSPTTKKKANIKIGCHGNITVDFARNAAKNLSAMVASGVDPRDKKKEAAVEQKRSILFGEFYEIFKERYMLTNYKDKGSRNMYYAKLHLLPNFSQKEIGQITQKDIKVFHESMSNKKTTANRSISFLSVIFRKAVEWDYLPLKSNPCTDIPKYKEKKKQRFLSRLELKKLEDALDMQEKENISSYYTVNAIRLALYLGCRKSNILNLKWEDVHLKENYIHLPDTKVGESACPLNDKAIELLSSIKRKEGNPYVFPGRIPEKSLVGIAITWRKVLKRAGIKGLRFHDLRHSFASFCLSEGVDLYTVSKLLGHKNIQTTTRYAHLELEQLKKATNMVSKVFG